jgi:alanyl-tRNA synthetase
MKLADIREKFLAFFESKGHTRVASSPLFIASDPTLMFVNSGMVQFKDVFTGADKRAYTRATSAQRSVRAGGKHNDLENVGYTARHHTFFEMLGNFSFGDYFKTEAIKFAWELLTVTYGLPKEKLLVTVYADDDEAFNIWRDEIGVPIERIVRIGDNKGARYASDNFWMMGDIGPCGPCSEIFYDHGAHIPGGPPGSPDEDGDRFIEIWNLVFMQFNREVKDGPMLPLPKPCVDTGMGMERLAAILQHVHSNYEIDLFVALIAVASRETGCTDLANPSLRVIADHIRACSFLITDGVIPSNEGRGYVLRRIIRRALRHGYKLGQTKPFFYKLVAELDVQMGDAYPELRAAKDRVAETLHSEEIRFGETLVHGMAILESALAAGKPVLSSYARLRYQTWTPTLHTETRGTGDGRDSMLLRKGDDQKWVSCSLYPCGRDDIWSVHDDGRDQLYSFSDVQTIDGMPVSSLGTKMLDGTTAFQLYDTFGFPLDLTADVCRERGAIVDEAGFETAMEKQRTTARAAGKFKADTVLAYSGDKTVFHGYDELSHAGKVVALYKGGTPVQSLDAGDGGVVVLDHTPFYAESGGQVGDTGLLLEPSPSGGGQGGGSFEFRVNDTLKIIPDVFGHHGKLESGSLKVGDSVNAQVDTNARARTIRNHSVTHLMHKALREVLGSHVAQKGSLVDAEKTRFDFAHNAPMTDAQIREVEAKVNAEIVTNTATHAEVMPIEKAKTSGATMLFGEKYGDEARVLEIGTSKEFCGGTHVARTGDIGFFKIISEGGVAAGVRRVEAVTGLNAMAFVQALDARMSDVAGALKIPQTEVTTKIAQIQDHVKALEKELAALKSKLAAAAGGDLLSKVVERDGVMFLSAEIEGADAKALREMVDQLKNKLGSGVVLLGSKSPDGKVALCAGVTADLVGKFKAGDIVGKAAAIVGGKGGGRPDMAMAGGVDGAKLGDALASLLT